MELNWSTIGETAKDVSQSITKAKAEEAKWAGIASCVAIGGVIIMATIGILTDPTRKSQNKGE